MSCRLENITDAKLIDLKSRLGDKAGELKWLGLYGYLQKNFTSTEKVGPSEIISMNNLLESHNDETGENHSLRLTGTDGEFAFGEKPLNPHARYTVDINVDWNLAETVESLYSPTLFNDDGDFVDDAVQDKFAEEIVDVDEEMNDAIKKEIAFLRAEKEGAIGGYDVMAESEADMQEEIDSMGDIRDAISQVLILTGRKIIDIKSRTGKLITNLKDIKDQLSKLKSISAPVEQIATLESRAKIIAEKIDFNKDAMEGMYHKFLVAKKSRNIDQLTSLFYEHYEFAVKLANSDNVDEGDLALAINALNMWSNIHDIATGGNVQASKDIKEKLLQIQKKANDSSIDDLKEKARDLLVKYGSEVGVTIGTEDFKQVEDVGGFEMNLRTIGETKIRLLNLLDRFLKNSHLRVKTELFDVRKSIQKMFSELHKSGLKVDMFFERDENGRLLPKIIGRLNSKYYEDIKKINDGFKSAIDTADSHKDQKIRASHKTRAINNRNTALLERHYIIDPTKLFDPESHAKIKKELTVITGSERAAEEKINEALNKYQQYMEDRANKKFALISEGRDLDDVDNRIVKFGLARDPSKVVEYMNKKDVGDDIRNTEWGDQYLTMVPRNIMGNRKAASTGYYNESFQSTILNNSKALEFYNKYLGLMEQLTSYLPYYVTQGLPENFYPSLEKEFWSKASSGVRGRFGIFSGITRGVIDSMSTSRAKITPTTDITGNPIRKVPTSMINDVKEENRSLDMEKALYAFAESAISYKYMSQVEDKATLTMQMLRDVKAVTTNPDGTLMRDKTGIQKKQLENAIKLGQYAIDNNIYGIRYKEEGVTSKKFFDKERQAIMLVDQENYDTKILDDYYKLTQAMSIEEANVEIIRLFPNKVVLVTEKEANKALQSKLRQLDDQRYFKQIEEHKFNAQTEKIKSVAGLLGRSFSWAKLMDNTINFGYYKSFSWNIFPAFANKAFGDISIMNHAAGGRDFSTGEAMWAIKEALSSSLSSINSGRMDNNRLYNLCHKFGLISEIIDSSKMRKSFNMSVFNPMAMMSSSDFQIRAATMGAMMKSKKIINLKGEEKSLWDAFNNDGTWNTEEFGDDEKWNGNRTEFSDNTELYKFVNKIRAVNMMLHGNMDADTNIMAKASVLGRLLGQYRVSWMIPGINARFEGKRYDTNLERFVEGRFVSTGRFVMNNGLTGTIDTLLKLAMMQGSKAFDGKNISAEDRAMIIENVKKTLHELMLWGALYGSYLLLSASMDDKDSDDAKFKYAALNSLNRIMGDISFYFSPNTFENILNNVVPSMSVLTDFLRFTRSLEKHMQGQEYYDDEKLFLDLTRQLPGFNMINKFSYQTKQLLMQKN